MAKIGFIGTGEIASAMVKGLTGQGHTIVVSKRGAQIAADLSKFSDVSIAENDVVVGTSDIVVLCLLKDVANAVLPDLPFRADQHILSVMVDVSHDQLGQLCAPATSIAITSPLPNIAVGGCPLPCFPNTTTVQTLFGARNPVFAVGTESGLNAHFAVTALASTSFAQAKVAANWLAKQTGDTTAAETYIVSMLAGFFQSLPQDGQDRLAEALGALSTEGGLNATLRQHMKDAGAEDQLKKGLDGFKDRLGLP